MAEERVRIARELHDVVAHHLALANAQAGTAAHLVRRNPAQAEQLITELAGTTSSALRELKATVGLLRSPDDPDSPLEPAPGLARLPELIATHEAAGLAVTVTTTGDAVPLAAGVDLTAYRIVQEALTNVTKHAATTAAQVTLAYAGNLLTITVSDEGGGPHRHRRTAPSPPIFEGPPKHPRRTPSLMLPRSDPRRTPDAPPCPARRRPGPAARHVPHADRLLRRHGGRR